MLKIPFLGDMDFSARTTWVGLSGVVTGIFLIVGGHVQEGILAVLAGAGMVTTRAAISNLAANQTTPPASPAK